MGKGGYGEQRGGRGGSRGGKLAFQLYQNLFYRFFNFRLIDRFFFYIRSWRWTWWIQQLI
jgi:hypothetical protein